jgi:hypothetical protein
VVRRHSGLTLKPVLIYLPVDIPSHIDTLVGKQKRSEFIRGAIARKLNIDATPKAEQYAISYTDEVSPPLVSEIIHPFSEVDSTLTPVSSTTDQYQIPAHPKQLQSRQRISFRIRQGRSWRFRPNRRLKP